MHTHTVCSAECFSVRVSCQSFNGAACCFREPEKRASEKKPTGSTSPPAGSPAPSTTPSSATIRSAFLPYAPAFSVILQCLKMVHALAHTHKVSVSTDNATLNCVSYRLIPFLAMHILTFYSRIHILTWYLKKMWRQQACFCFSRTGDGLEGAEAGSRQAAVDAAVQSAATHVAVQPGPAVFHTLQHGKLKYLHKTAGRYHIQHISYFIY